MTCQVCQTITGLPLLCRTCRLELRHASERLVDGRRLFAAFEHVGPARRLIHHVKYRGLTSYLDLVAATVAASVPPGPLAPVPRALSRRLRFGIDPARELAIRIAELTGLPVVRLFLPPIHSRRRAGGNHERVVPEYVVTRHPQDPVVLVDDVFTTGATMASAIRAVGPGNVRAAVVANVVPEVSSLLRQSIPHSIRES